MSTGNQEDVCKDVSCDGTRAFPIPIPRFLTAASGSGVPRILVTSESTAVLNEDHIVELDLAI